MKITDRDRESYVARVVLICFCPFLFGPPDEPNNQPYFTTFFAPIPFPSAVILKEQPRTLEPCTLEGRLLLLLLL